MAHMAADDAGVEIVSAAGRIADIEIHIAALVEVLDALGERDDGGGDDDNQSGRDDAKQGAGAEFLYPRGVLPRFLP